ncbi:MAG: mitochondrial fission ELM1 family protein [Beijerinckiaceae bacterium]
MTFSVSDAQLDEAKQLISGASCWILSDGKAGDEAQCLGVTERLGLKAEIRRIKPRAPWVWIMPWGPVDPAEAPDKAVSPIAPPFPDIVIASGRRTVAYLRAIRKASEGRAMTVYLKDPSTGANTADMIWVPRHDKLRGANVLATLTSPHRISRERLNAARAQKPSWLAPERTMIGVMLGGDSQHHRFTADNIRQLTDLLGQHARAGAHLIVTPSRRTPAALAEAIRELCHETGGFWWDGSGDNPYLSILAHADHLVVTADSVNMLGEAASTGKPVHLFTPDGGHTKISSFVKGLIDHGAVRALSNHLETWAYEPLDATPIIAVALAEAFARRR